MVVKSAKIVLKKMFAFVSIAVEMQAMLHIVSFQNFIHPIFSSFGFWYKQKSYKCDNQLITWLTGITRPAGSCNLVTLKTNFDQYKNFVLCSITKPVKIVLI